jgi:hypothetical protein
MCWYLEPSLAGLAGVCTPFCSWAGASLTCPSGYQCDLGDAFMDLCTPICDPIAQDCPDGQGCYWSATKFECVPTSQDFPAGSPCGYVNDCAPGHACVDSDQLPQCAGASCCTPFCDLEEPDACAESIPQSSCLPWFGPGEAPAGLGNLGVCVLADS